MDLDEIKSALTSAADNLETEAYALLSGPVSRCYEEVESTVRRAYGSNLSESATEAIAAIGDARGKVDQARTQTAGAAEALREIAVRLGQ